MRTTFIKADINTGILTGFEIILENPSPTIYWQGMLIG
jgi:hypothetical protein